MALQKKKHENNDLAALTIGYYKITISVKGIFTYAHVDKKISYYISVSIFLAMFCSILFLERTKFGNFIRNKLCMLFMIIS